MVSTSILAVSTKRRNEPQSLSDIAYQRIKERIVSLELPPASLLDEAQLAQELELGLTPVRQALRKLEMKNLVVILPRRGTLVADLNLSDLQKIYEMRTELEVLAAQLAAQRATSEQIEALRTLIQNSLDMRTAGNNRQLIALDREIHLLIAEASQNEFLAETVEWLYNHVQRLWNLTIEQVTDLDKIVLEHQPLCEAIAAGHVEEAGVHMRSHVQHFQETYTKTLTGLT